MNSKWLAFSYKLPSEPSKARVYVWRNMKELGAVYLQQGVALLPHTEAIRDILTNFYTEIAKLGGEATLSELSFLFGEDEARILSQFESLRNDEFQEQYHECERLIYVLEQEMAINKFSFTELEENEEELNKIKRCIAKIEARDYFQASGRERTLDMLSQAEKKLQQYSDLVYQNDKMSPD